MNILYIGYWSVYDGLSVASIQPSLKILSSFEHIDNIVYVSIERENDEVKFNWDIEKIEHLPFYSPSKKFLRDKVSDFTLIPRTLKRICNDYKIDKILCRSSPAGAIGYLLHKKTGIDYIVESFEPHADYMLESGVWRKWGLRYWIQKFFEQKQKKTANELIVVSENYKNFLTQKEFVQVPISVIPCTIDHNEFKFSKQHRKQIRSQLAISDSAVVGIYVGKFGGIYYEEAAFRFFKSCYDNLTDFFLIVLSPQDKAYVNSQLEAVGFPTSQRWINRVPYNEVSNYLSASDISFCFHKSHSYSLAYSPIKNAEYWANGLPIVMDKDIGDDSSLVKKFNCGLIYSFKESENKEFFKTFPNTISIEDRSTNNSVQIGKLKRSIDYLFNNYKRIFTE